MVCDFNLKINIALHKMIYKCEHCDYSTKRLCDLRRHQNKKFKCYNKLKVSVDNVEDGRHINGDVLDINGDVLDINGDVLDINGDVLNVNANEIDKHNSINKELICSKCFKGFSRKSIRLKHESKCDGLDSRQCKICLKMFTTYQGKYQHNKNVNCSPPPIQQPQTVNNITNNNGNNNIDMSTTNNIQNIHNNNIQLTLNFGNEDLSGLINEPNYMRNVERQIQSFISQLPYLNEDAGKIIIAEVSKKIYFNDKYPQNQTIKKSCKKDNTVKIFQNNEWKPRVVEDVFKRVSGKVEEYFLPYFETLYDKYESLTKEELSGEDKYIITNSRGFGNKMVWFNWDDIIHPIVEINGVMNKTLQLPDLDDDDSDTSSDKDIRLQNRILKNTIKCLSQQLYENSQAK